MNEVLYKNQVLLGAGLVSLSVLLSVGFFIYNNIAPLRTVHAIGHAEEKIVADTVTWEIRLSMNFDGPGGVSQEKSQMNFEKGITTVKNFLTSKGVSADSIDVSQNMRGYPSGTSEINATINVHSSDVRGVFALSQQMGSLADKVLQDHISVSFDEPLYYYLDREMIYQKLLDEAVADAAKNAKTLLSAQGEVLGSLVSSDSSVSIVSSGMSLVDGYNDNKLIEKTAIMTVDTTYRIH